MQIVADACSGAGPAERLLVLLPPAEARPADFVEQGFVAAVRRRRIPIDLVAAGLTYEHVIGNTVVAALHENVVRPAQAASYREIWLAGISLGAFNALHYAAEHAGDLAGIFLIAPYPGTGDILAEIARAGGTGAWSVSPQAELGDERRWWRWLCREAADGRWTTPVYFGTGHGDRFLRGQKMLAELLPRDRVRYVAGEHAWPVWLTLWEGWLDDGPLAGSAPCANGAVRT
jgi:pimeloyl-ACP methyl ester carboxylesterase